MSVGTLHSALATCNADGEDDELPEGALLVEPEEVLALLDQRLAKLGLDPVKEGQTEVTSEEPVPDTQYPRHEPSSVILI